MRKIIQYILDRSPFWLLDSIGERQSEKTYIGHGDFTEEYGWEIKILGKYYWVKL